MYLILVFNKVYLLILKKKKNHNASSYDKCVLENFLNATFGVLIPIKVNRLYKVEFNQPSC